MYAGERVVHRCAPGTAEFSLDIPLSDVGDAPFVRVEAQGDEPKKLMASTPFFLK